MTGSPYPFYLFLFTHNYVAHTPSAEGNSYVSLCFLNAGVAVLKSLISELLRVATWSEVRHFTGMQPILFYSLVIIAAVNDRLRSLSFS